MQINGQWVGWGPGDDDPKVQDMKRYLKRKFTWVRESPLDDSTFYDDTMALVVMELQTRYHLPVTGIMNAKTQEVCGYYKPAPARDMRPVLFTVCGTGVPWWVGPDADVARQLESENRVKWQPVGYPATPVPMWPSIQNGLAELVRLVNLPEYAGRRIMLIGYSQGAIVTSLFYTQHVRGNPDLENRFAGAVTYGNPMREKGNAFADGVLPVPPADHSGILDEQIVNTPSNWRDYAHQGDMYADCGFDQNGGNKRAICKMIMGHNIFSGPDSIVAQLLELGLNPFGNGLALFHSLYDAGMFFVVKKITPHTNYNPWPSCDFLRSLT
jgi:hypothetical protein